MSSPISPHPKTRQGKLIIKTVAQLKPKKPLLIRSVGITELTWYPPKSAFLEKKQNKKRDVGRGDEGGGSERGQARKGWFSWEGLISPESTLCSRGGRPSCCVLEASVGEDALGELLLRPLEAGSCASVQGVHLGGKDERDESAIAAHTSLWLQPGPPWIPASAAKWGVLSEITAFRPKTPHTATAQT